MQRKRAFIASEDKMRAARLEIDQILNSTGFDDGQLEVANIVANETFRVKGLFDEQSREASLNTGESNRVNRT